MFDMVAVNEQLLGRSTMDDNGVRNTLDSLLAGDPDVWTAINWPGSYRNWVGFGVGARQLRFGSAAEPANSPPKDAPSRLPPC